MTDPDPIVRLRDVTFAYRDRLPVLEDANLDIDRQDYLGIVGPNGSGKTTLLRLILGLLRPSRGHVTVFGRDPRSVRHRIGYVPQHARVDTEVPATALDVVLMGRLRLAPWGPGFSRHHRELAEEALARVGVESLADRRLAEMSGGQRQRVLIARALVGNAELLLLDEPTSGVDSVAENRLMELLAELNQRIPVAIVSHDVSLVSSHLKHVAFVGRSIEVQSATALTHERLARHFGHHAPSSSESPPTGRSPSSGTELR